MSFPAKFQEYITRIAGEKRLGSSALAELALNALAALAGETDAHTLLERAVGLVKNLRPSMPLIGRVAEETLSRYQELVKRVGDADYGHILLRAVDEVRREYRLMVEQLAANAQELIADKRCVATISYSGTVKQVLTASRWSGSVVILESRPMREGFMLAEELSNIRSVEVMVDAAMSYAVAGADAILIGADAVFKKGGFIGKIGCYPLCMLAQKAGKPVYVLADTWKFSDSLDIPLEEGEPEEVWPEARRSSIKIRNPYFEVTPHELVTAYVTEHGVVESDSLV